MHTNKEYVMYTCNINNTDALYRYIAAVGWVIIGNAPLTEHCCSWMGDNRKCPIV
jgi:hypothetical protein